MIRCKNPIDVDPQEAQDIYEKITMEGSTEYPGSIKYRPIIRIAKELLPKDWKIIFAPRKYIGDRSGICMYGYKIVGVTIQAAEYEQDMILSMFHEIYHAVSVERYSKEFLNLNIPWDELDCGLYALMVIFRSAESPFKTMKALLEYFLPYVMWYGVAHASRYKLDSVPKRWEFLKPYINAAVNYPGGYRKFEYNMIKKGIEHIPSITIKEWSKLIEKGPVWGSMMSRRSA